MLETSKDKLNRIKTLMEEANQLAPSNNCDDIGRIQDILTDMFQEDLDWLVTQAEENARLKQLVDMKNMSIDMLGEQKIERDKEIKQLRETLMEIQNIDEHPKFKGIILEHNDYLDQLIMIEEIARQVLSKSTTPISQTN